MLTAILALFALAVAAPLVAHRLPRAAGWALAILPAYLTVWFFDFVPAVAAGRTVREETSWFPAMDAVLSFHLDGLALVFALLVCGIGALVVVYSGGCLRAHPDRGRLLLLILGFMGAMLGLVLADNVILLLVFWELTTVASFLLIGFEHDDPRARRSARQALLVTAPGGFGLIAGMILLAQAGGSWELSELTGGTLAGHPAYPAILALVLFGAFTKSAQLPFHFWLPNAMDAPAPVSAYLHSATMVKAGIYLLARLNPTLGGTEAWTTILMAVGGLTAVGSALVAVRQTDLKKVMAYTTVTVLGQLVLLIGVGNRHALQAFAAYLIAHALYKAALFMSAGAVDHETGTRDFTHLGGLVRAMPVTAAGIGLAALSYAGLPPALGFVGKEQMYHGLLAAPGPVWLAVGVMVVANALLVVTAGLVFVKPFLGGPVTAPGPVRETAPSLWLGALVLGVLGIVAGLFNTATERGLVAGVVASVAGAPLEVKLYLWDGLTPPLFLSLATFALGALTYAAWPWVKPAFDRIDAAVPVNPDRAYDRALVAFEAAAARLTARIQPGRLSVYVRVLFAAAALGVGGTLVLRGALVAPAMPGRADTAWVFAAIVLIAGLAAARARSRATAVLSLGAAGVAIALIYLLHGAPDLAITQFMVETLTVVFIVLAFLRLPDEPLVGERERRPRVLDAAVAVACGATVTALVLAVIAVPFDPLIGRYYAEHSVPEAHGRNVVNVVLVDFRAFDTLGEITVLVVAGLGALGLSKRRGRRSR